MPELGDISTWIGFYAPAGTSREVVGKIQHSTDNSSWADLATFTTVTAVTSQQVVVAAATTVNRYTRALATITGVGTMTYAVTFARR